MGSVIKASSIREYFKNNVSQLRRGEHEAQCHNVRDIIYDSTATPAILDGTVGSSSIKNKSYSVQVLIDNNEDTILKVDCTCPKENGKCHHMATLCIYAYKNLKKDTIF